MPSDDNRTRVYLEGPPSRDAHNRETVVALGDARDHAASVPLPYDERYTLVRALGSGGMGVVEACDDAVLQRVVARKRLREAFVGDARAERALEREASLMARLSHPSIMPVFDAGRTERGPFYTMRLAEERSLAHVLAEAKAAPDGENVLGVDRALRIFVQIGHAVAHAHDRGITHCDIKLENVLLGTHGEILLVDWGLAHRAGEPTTYRGGTPGFMAPEMFDPERLGIDGAADVFALGALLYELLSFVPAFEGPPPSMRDSRMSPPIGRRAVPPGERPGARRVPAVLEALCLSALEPKREDRIRTAGELVVAVESFVSGKKEAERRARRAKELVEEGDTLLEQCVDMQTSRKDRLAELYDLRRAASAGVFDGAEGALADAEDRFSVMDHLEVQSFQSAQRAYEQALSEVADSAEASRGLARLYRGQLAKAESSRNELARAYFEGLVRQHDKDWEANTIGALTLDVRPAGATVLVSRYEERQRVLASGPEVLLGLAPLHGARLAAGSYLARIVPRDEAEGGDVVVPVLVRGGRETRVEIDLANAAEVRPGEVFVAGGTSILGGSELNLLGEELQEKQVAPFAIGRLPVSFAEYLDFLRVVALTEPDRAESLLPRTDDGAALWDFDGETPVPAWITRLSDAEEDELASLPLFGISYFAAEAYAAHVARATGRPYRLPTDFEWERAARGADGRRYPWGNRFDASLCLCREGRHAPARPLPSGRFASDVSPFGVRDLAGGVADWVVADGEDGALAPASRGGAFTDVRTDCYLGARRPYDPDEHELRVGLRLVRSLTPRAQ